MDTHRVLATVLKAWGYYRDAIDEYNQASQITPTSPSCICASA
jgi:hypothetical protein